MRVWTLFSVCLMLVCCYAQNLEKEVCDATRSVVNVQTSGAQAMIGGLFEIRSPSRNGYACGQPHKELIQVYEAAVFALDKVNSNMLNTIGIKLGMKAFDTCGLRSVAIKYAEDFYPQYSSMESSCSLNSTISLGFLGPLSSWTTKPVAALGSSWPASVLSPRAASPDLSNKQMYPYFLRTSPSLAGQTRAIIAVMNQLSWKRIVVIRTSSEYGNDGYNVFLKQAYSKGICIVKVVVVPEYGSAAEFQQALDGIGSVGAKVAMFFGSYLNAVTLFSALETVSGADNLQYMFTDLNLMEAYSSKFAKGAIYVGPEVREVSEFASFFTNINERNPPANNPWFQDWYMTHYDCNLGVSYPPFVSKGNCATLTPAQKLANFRQVPYVTSTVKAVYAYAKALRDAHSQKCASIPGVCSSLRSMTTNDFHNNYLKRVNFQFTAADGLISMLGDTVKFDGNGDMPISSFAVYNYNNRNGPFSFEKVGTFIAENLTLDYNRIMVYDALRANIVSVPTSVCPASGCGSCLIPRGMVDFYFTPGDVVIGGAMSVHRRGMEPFSCGIPYPDGLPAAVAFDYGIKTAKDKFPAILNGVSLGSLVMDTCNSAETGLLFMNNVLGERHIVHDRNGKMVDRNNIKAFVESMGSSTTKDFSMGLHPFLLPEVGTIATSVDLSDKMTYPYFTRVVPADDKQATAILNILISMGWYYIQTLQSADSYSRSGVEWLKNLGSYHSICVSASYEFGTDGSHAEILQKLRKNQQARVVVIFSGTSDTRALLQAVKDSSVLRDFVLIASDYWGSRQDIISGYQDIAHGVITLDVAPYGTAGFKSWLNTLNPRQAMDIPWFREWYQVAYNCYIDAVNKGMYTNECTGAQITNAPGYSEGYGVSYTINAVYAVAMALHQTLEFICGKGYSGVCAEFRASKFTQQVLLENLKNSTFTAENNAPFEMVNGEGTASYNVYSYSTNSGYSNVGNYNTKTGQLTLTKQNIVYPTGVNPTTFTSTCAGYCYECAYVTEKPLYYDVPGSILIGGVFGVHAPSQDGFSCGLIKTVDGFQFGSAMVYAVEMVNSNLAPVSLNGITLGTILFDNCGVGLRTFDLLASLYSGTSKPFFWRDKYIDPETVMAWVTDSTAAVMEAKDVVNKLNLPLISPLATSEDLSDLNDYPTFFRTVGGDVSLSIAMAELARSLDFKYVTIIYSDSAYGIGGKETFESVAQQEGICILQSYKMDGSMTAQQIINSVQSSTAQVVMLWTGVADSKALLEAKQNHPLGSNLVFIFPMPFMSLVQQYGAGGSNTFTLNIKRSEVESYKQFMENMYAMGAGDSPLLISYYMTIHKCDLPGYFYYNKPCPTQNGQLVPVTEAAGYEQDNYVVPTVNAVYAFVAALDATLKEKCGMNYHGVCSAFTTTPNINDVIMQHMETTTFRDPTGSVFQFLDRKGNTGLDVHFYNGVTSDKVAEFAGASLQITDGTLKNRFGSTASSCQGTCTVCITQSLNFTYIPGDILLGGIFDVHFRDLTPFSCGPLKTFHGFQLLEAFNYAINQVNDKSGQFANILKHVSLGGVGLDSCQSSIRTGYLVSNIHSGLTKLSRNGFTLNPDDINAYIAGYSSDSSIYLARILKTLKVPQISYASTSTELLDSDKYPYFMRSVPADDKQSMAMIAFFKKYNIKYVQIVHTATNYGERGAKIFSEKAKENKICVAQSVAFPDNGTVTQESANDVIASLLTRPMANTVVVFADQDYINEMFRAIARNPVAVNKFKFIGSDSWSSSMEAISGVEHLAEGSITLNLESSDLPDFDIYLGKKTPGNYPENPWFTEFYERMVDCYLTVPTNSRSVQCPPIPENIVAQRNYVQDPGILHVINAVYAAAIGIDKALKFECGENYTTVCEKYKNNQDRTDLLMDSIVKARFTDPASKNFEFSTRREGNKGYQLFSITKKMTMNDVGYTYDKIGLYTSDDQLQTTSTYKPSWDGSCERDRSCSECPSLRNLLTRYMIQSKRDLNAATLIYVRSMHDRGSDAEFTLKCGTLNMQSFLGALAFQFTLEEYFKNTKYNIRGLVLDNCDNPVRGDHDLYSLMATGTLCNTQFEFDGNINSSTIAGVHVSKSMEAVSANRALASFRIPIVSDQATSTLLSNKEKFPYFARTIPPDDKLAEVLTDILKEHGWKYVSAIYSREPYGASLIDALRTTTNKHDVCVGTYLSVPYPADVEDVKPILQELVEQRGANVILLLTLEPRVVLQAARELGILGKYLFIGTDTWDNYPSVVQGFENEVLGSITVGVRNAKVENFRNYVKTLSYQNRKNIPDDWFLEFYQLIHKCRLDDASVIHTEFNRVCTKSEVITNTSFPEWEHLRSVASAYALAKAVDVIANRECSSSDTFPECIADPSNYNVLFNRLLGVQWDMHNALELYPKESFALRFNNDRYWDIGYKIYNYVRLDNGGYEYKKIGAKVNETTVFDSAHNSYRPDDFTSLCPPGRGTCGCGVTVTVPLRQTGNDSDITEPRNYFFYNKAVTPWQQLYNWPIWAIVVAVLTCIGLFITIFLFVYFLIAYPVKGGTTVLGFMMMIGIMGIYALNFAFFLPASVQTCIGRRFMMGVVYAIVFAALLVKAIDNWRYCDYEYTVRKYKGITNSCTLLLISLGIVLVQLIIPIMWLLIIPAGAISKSDSMYHDWMWCDPWEDYDLSLVLSMIFVMFLVLLTAIFAAMAWDSDCNYYESRWIFVGCTCTAGCFIVWMVVTTNAAPPNRDPAVAISNFVNATALLIFLPIRKLGLLLYFQKLEGKDMDITQPISEDDKGLELYSSAYNEGYEPDPNLFMPADSKHSDAGSGYGMKE